MKVPDGGGLSAAGRARREALRLQAAAWFAEGIEPLVVARRLRVSANSAYQWRRRWRAGGAARVPPRRQGLPGARALTSHPAGWVGWAAEAVRPADHRFGWRLARRCAGLGGD